MGRREERIYFLTYRCKSNIIPKQAETLVYWISLSFTVEGWGCLLSDEFSLQESVNQGTYELLSWYSIRKPCIGPQSRPAVFKFSSFSSGDEQGGGRWWSLWGMPSPGKKQRAKRDWAPLCNYITESDCAFIVLYFGFHMQSVFWESQQKYHTLTTSMHKPPSICK